MANTIQPVHIHRHLEIALFYVNVVSPKLSTHLCLSRTYDLFIHNPLLAIRHREKPIHIDFPPSKLGGIPRSSIFDFLILFLSQQLQSEF